MSILGIDFNNVATPIGIFTIIVIILGMTIFYGFRYLNNQSELARINRELTEQITKLSNDLGKTRESYERVVNNLDIAQQQVIFLHSWLNPSNGANNRGNHQEQ